MIQLTGSVECVCVCVLHNVGFHLGFYFLAFADSSRIHLDLDLIIYWNVLINILRIFLLCSFGSKTIQGNSRHHVWFDISIKPWWTAVLPQGSLFFGQNKFSTGKSWPTAFLSDARDNTSAEILAVNYVTEKYTQGLRFTRVRRIRPHILKV